jgi:hypothetical protein
MRVLEDVDPPSAQFFREERVCGGLNVVGSDDPGVVADMRRVVAFRLVRGGSARVREPYVRVRGRDVEGAALG